MNVTRLRAIMHRYKEAGVLLVGAYLVGHHLWTKRRIALLTTPATLLVLACWLAGVLRGPASVPKLAVTPSLLHVVRPAEFQSPIYRPQQPLLPHARQVTALDEYYLTHFWVSTNRLLLVTSARPTRTYDSVDVFPNEWQGQATLLDVRAGRRKLEGLTRVFHKMHAMPDSFETSPGGTWLKWVNRETGDGWSRPVVARWDGSGFQQWDQGRDSYAYWLDDRRWIDEERPNYGDSYAPNDIFVYDAEQQTTLDLEPHSKAGHRLIHTHYAVCEHGFKTSWEPEKSSGPRVTIFEEKDTNNAPDDVPPLQTYTFCTPRGAEVRQVLVSPKTRRVLYVLYFRQVAEAIRLQPQSGVFDIWTSRLDGSGLKELGYLETGELDDFEDMDPMTAQNMIKLEWLPDGKQFSFIYRRKLYRAAGY